MKDRWPLIPMGLGVLGPFLVFMSAAGPPVLATVGMIVWAVGAVGSTAGGVVIFFRRQRETALVCIIVGVALLVGLVFFSRMNGAPGVEGKGNIPAEQEVSDESPRG